MEELDRTHGTGAHACPILRADSAPLPLQRASRAACDGFSSSASVRRPSVAPDDAGVDHVVQQRRAGGLAAHMSVARRLDDAARSPSRSSQPLTAAARLGEQVGVQGGRR